MKEAKQISVTFGRDEVELLTLLDEVRKQEHMTRSAWFKQQIRNKYGNTKAPGQQNEFQGVLQ